MSTDHAIPVARPFGPELESVPTARMVGHDAIPEHSVMAASHPCPPPIPYLHAEVSAPLRTEHTAVASAVCGMSAMIPIVSQIAGLVLGFLALGRIRKARRSGVIVGGRRYALTGIVSSSLALAGWLAFGVLMFSVNKTLAHTLKPLTAMKLNR